MRIRTLIITSFLITSIIVSSTAIYFSKLDDLNQSKKQYIEYLETIASSRANQIQIYLNQNIEKFRLFTNEIELKDELQLYNSNKNPESIKKIRNRILNAKNSLEDIKEISIIDMNGKIITSTNPNLIKTDLSDKSFFTNSKQKEIIYFSKENETIDILISGPLIRNGKLIGIGIMKIKNDKLKSIIKDKTGLKKSGQILIAIQKNGKISYLTKKSDREKEQYNKIKNKGIDYAMEQALNGKIMFFDELYDYNNKKVLAVSQSIILDSFNQKRLGIVIKIDRDETFGGLEAHAIYASIMIFIGVVLAVLIISFFVSRLITTPINKLTYDVNEITKGNLDILLSKSSIDEIENLTESLNRILASLKLAILKKGIDKNKIGLGNSLEEKKKTKNIDSLPKKDLNKTKE